MARRLFDNGEWTQEASHTHNEATVAIANILALLEQTEGPVDLHDLHYILTAAAGTFVADLSIRRRLGPPNTPPSSKINLLPRLSCINSNKNISSIPNTKDEHEYAWEKIGFCIPAQICI